MEELIKCAEALYGQIDEAQMRLVKSRLDKDEKGAIGYLRNRDGYVQRIAIVEVLYRAQGQYR